MFVYHVKINGSKVFKMFFSGVIVLIICISCFVTFKVFGGASQESAASDFSCVPQNTISDISPRNYTNVLKAVHDDIDSYLGVKFHFTGYMYRLLDFTDTQFVLARDMVISSDFQTVVVGFLCEYNTASTFEDGSWVEITGEITKGDYHGDIPVVKIMSMQRTNKPNEELVYPPDESYIPTSGIV